MTTLRIDLETYSSVDLKKCGVHKYADSNDFEILLFGFKFGSGPAHVIDLAQGERLPAHIVDAIDDPKVLKTANNAAVENACLSKHLGRQLDVTQWRCTSVHALYLGLPGNLADVGKVIGLPDDKQKSAVGWGLIRYFCIPCKPTKKNGQRKRNLPRHEPGKWQLFKDYCRQDVEAEHAISERIARFQLPDVEWRLWHLDQQMMNRGVMVDRHLVEAAIECDAIVKQRLLNEAIQLTGLANPNSRNQLLEWLQAEEDDDTIVDLTKKTVPKVLESTDSDVVRRVLELRQELAKTSVSKYHAMARAMCADDCVRGVTQFYGANRTGRWAGRIVQMQNLPQNKLKDLDLARELLKARDYDTLELVFGNVPDTLSQLIRTAFVARPGHKFIPVDFSAIEARVVAWLAWCAWRLEVFKTHGMIYEASASAMFKVPIESIQYKGADGKKHKGPNYGLRQKGKIAELALGYQGGEGALKTMGALEMGIPEAELDPIKVAWREANPEIVALWYEAERCAKRAVQLKTTVPMHVGPKHLNVYLEFAYEAGFMTIKLPSGRKLFYVKPRIETEDLYREIANGGRYVIASAGSLTYEGMDQKTKKWMRLSTYGGKLIENITQAIARDCLREAMLALDKHRHQQLFTVHDEIIVESRLANAEDLQKVEALLGDPIPWAPELPLRGDGFETVYYMKEID